MEHGVDAAVVGAGQAGLAAADALAGRGLSTVVLEASDEVGGSWHRRWDALRLFTPAHASRLPGAPLDAENPAAPSRHEVAAHLEAFARARDLDVRLSSPVGPVRREGTDLVLTAPDLVVRSRAAVLATGAHREPWLPEVARRLGGVEQLHATDYRRPDLLPAGPVLVVGAANSGAEIALDLVGHGREVELAGRDVGHLPRATWTVLPLLRASGRLGAAAATRGLGGHGDPLGRIPRGGLERAGVRRVPRVVDAGAGWVGLADGTRREPAVVVWATGHGHGLDWAGLDLVDARGRVRLSRGGATPEPGVFLLGRPFQRTVASHLVGGVHADARHVARLVSCCVRAPAAGR